MKITLILAVFIFSIFCNQAFAQPREGMSPKGMQGGGPGVMLSPQEMEEVKKTIGTEKTDVNNFNKRISLASGWIRQLVASGKNNEVIKVAPPGTIPRIKNSEQADPVKAYNELDKLLMDLNAIDAQAIPQKPDQPMQK